MPFHHWTDSSEQTCLRAWHVETRRGNDAVLKCLSCVWFNGTVHLPPAVMGMFQVKVKVASPAHPEKYFEQTFWVHTGALYTFIPEDRLASIELKPLCARAD